MPETSELWKSLSHTLFANVDDAFTAGFRRPGGANSRLGAWDPFDPTMRYFKFILQMAAERQPDRFFLLYRALGKVDIGAPVSVKVRSCAINIDYLLSVQEYLFLESRRRPRDHAVDSRDRGRLWPNLPRHASVGLRVSSDIRLSTSPMSSN
jgi:hypothetical protein